MVDRSCASSSVKPSPFAVGLTGGIGSGKSRVADLLARHGAHIIDTDAIAHALTATGGAAITAIRTTFGERFIDARGALDRARMREHVFAAPQAKKTLESILHPLIRAECERAATEGRAAPYIVFVVPLLVESGTWRERVHRVLVVDCPEDLQRRRVMARSGLSNAQVDAIIRQQASRAQRLAVADDVVVNVGSERALEPHAQRLHAHYVHLASCNSGVQAG